MTFLIRRARGLKIFEPQALQVLERRDALNSKGVTLVSAFVVPKPVLSSVGENYKMGAQVFGIATGLLFGLVGVKV